MAEQNPIADEIQHMTPEMRYYYRNREEKIAKVKERYNNKPEVIAKREDGRTSKPNLYTSQFGQQYLVGGL
jgi:hypothetical protein